LEEGRELDVLGGRDFLLWALLESQRAQRSYPLSLSKLNSVLKLWRVEQAMSWRVLACYRLCLWQWRWTRIQVQVSPKWVVERVKGYYKLVGVSCDHYEDKLLALFEEIEARRVQSLADSLAMVTTASGVKGQREIKRLDCSINYEKKGKQSNRRRGKGRGMSCVNEA
jgi:hypothetical protein